MSGIANLKPFKPGQVGNPTGANRWSKELQNLRNESKREVVKVIAQCMMMTRDQLRQTSENPQATMAEILVASVLAKAIKDGCPFRAQFLFNYILGKPKPMPTEEEHDDEAGAAAVMLNALPSAVIIDVLRSHAGAATPTP